MSINYLFTKCVQCTFVQYFQLGQQKDSNNTTKVQDYIKWGPMIFKKNMDANGLG